MRLRLNRTEERASNCQHTDRPAYALWRRYDYLLAKFYVKGFLAFVKAWVYFRTVVATAGHPKPVQLGILKFWWLADIFLSFGIGALLPECSCRLAQWTVCPVSAPSADAPSSFSLVLLPLPPPPPCSCRSCLSVLMHPRPDLSTSGLERRVT